MASSQTPSSLLPLLLVLVTFFFSFAYSLPTGIRTHLSHVDSAGNFTVLELLQRSMKRGEKRLARLMGIEQVQAPVHAGEGEFLMDLAIGTPTLPFPAIVDTGSDLIWTQCKPCVDCYKQPTPIFDPSTSSTFSKLSCTSDLCKALPTSDCDRKECGYTYSYGDSSITKGYLATENFTFGSSDQVPVPGIGFGCGESNSGTGFKQASGLVGLGRGPLSLISQMKLEKFSYCLTKFGESKQSPLLFGSLANLNGTGSVQTTPLVKSPSQPTFYYLSLKGITVGGKVLDIPSSTFEMSDDGSGGFIIDSGTSITYLEVDGYEQLKKAVLSQVKLPVADGSNTGLDLCFTAPTSSSSSISVDLPKLTFHFEGADLEIPVYNYMVHDTSTGLLCLAMAQSSGMSILGNFQQQNMQVLYDLGKEELSFVEAKCELL